MESPHNQEEDYWGTLINPDKSPAPLLNKLCFGIAQLIAKLDSTSGSSDLTPDKLARFYREVGGNFDSLFLQTDGPGLSFVYQSLGCFHTLQPTTNPFESPSIPALLPTGFVRWQVMNLRLRPDEHAKYLQVAVDRWDVPNPDGGTFPKVIPRGAFPEFPDQDTVQWSEKVNKMLQNNYHADQTSSHRYGHYPAHPGTRNYHRTPEDYFFYKDDHRFHDDTSKSMPRQFNDQTEDIRHYRGNRNSDGRSRTFRTRIFGNDSDIHSDSRTSSRNPSPRQRASPARVPLRSNTMRVRNQDISPERMSSYRKHRSMTSSDSSNNDDEVFPHQRHDSDDQRNRHSHHFSSARPPQPPRRHSYEPTSLPPNGLNRDRDPNYKADRNSSRSRRMKPNAKSYKNINDDPSRRDKTGNQPSQHEDAMNMMPRHVKYDELPPEVRAKILNRGGNRGNGTSSGSEGTRSSSNSSGEAGMKR